MTVVQLPTQRRPTWATVDLAAIAHNVGVLRRAADDAQVCAVVKADGYGHGAVPVAETAIDAGAASLGVALAEEGVELRDAGIAAPVLLLSEPPVDAFDDVVECQLRPALYTDRGVEAAIAAVRGSTRHEPLPVHLKVDTGMHRVGASPDDLVRLAAVVAAAPELDLEGVFTHCAVADEPDRDFTARQLVRFDEVLDRLAALGIRPRLRHAGNSAVTFCHPAGRYDLVRCGISLCGHPPAPSLASRDGVAELRPALQLEAEVSFAKRVPAGDGISYGLRYVLDRDATIATVPIGYADGVPRRLDALGGEVLIGGQRRRIAGTVTMDQITVDCGDDPVRPGDPVVLIGSQGAETITADDWATKLDTISYEIVCGIGRRVPRRYLAADPSSVGTG
ncbi:MAG: alanine racemase [Acidimicrobiales bacterium]